MQKIHLCLWFDGAAEEAMNFYCSVFKTAKKGEITRWQVDGPGAKKGDVLTVAFELEGLQITGLNGGPGFSFTEAVSLSVDCKDQSEVDYYWDKFIADGGKPVQCAWLKDRFGLSWQIVPSRLSELLSDPDAAKAKRVIEAM